MIRCVFVVAFICTIWVSLVQGKTNCDKLGVNFYDFIGCTKENTGGDCPFYNCKYERQPGKCLFNGSFVCAQGGCGFWGRPVEEGCRLEYELDKCCGQQNCERSTITCESNGKTYKEGERIYFKDQCFQCICTKDFNGKFDSDSCQRQPCDAEIEYQEQIENNCAPVYYKRDGNEALCCPSTFVCPSEDDKIIKSEESDTSLTCRYGDKTYKSDVTFTKSIHQYGRTREVTCKCVLPPLFTCIADY